MLLVKLANLRQRKPLSSARILGAVGPIVLLLFAGCATTPPPKEARLSIFYPPLPNPPRIQYLTTFSSASDLGGPPTPFAEFLLGKEQKDRDAVRKPYGVALFGGKLYVVDTRGPGYAIFDLEQKKYSFVRGYGNGKMQKPINITIDRDGTKYVTDTGKKQVLAFDKGDRFERAYGVAGQFNPGDVAIARERLYVTDLKHHQIQVLDKQSGKLLFKFGKVGAIEGDLFYPTNVILGPDDLLYVTDTGNFRIQVFTLDGQFVRSYGTHGTGLGQLARPKGVALDREGRIYVVDAAFENVQCFDPQGRLLLFFGEPGESPENLNLPTTVLIDYEHAPLFQKYAAPKFKLEYVILVASQFGRNKVNVYGFGKMEGIDYPAEQAAPKRP
jgi:DNA-binding beta-propeller fold protein YncE